MQRPDIWSDKEKVSKIGQRIREIKEVTASFSNWTTITEDAEIALEIGDGELISEALSKLKSVEKDVEKRDITKLTKMKEFLRKRKKHTIVSLKIYMAKKSCGSNLV